MQFIGAMVIEFHFLNQIKEKNTQNLCFYKYCTHTLSNYIKFFIRVNFHGDLHLGVSRCGIKLKLKVKIGISLSMVE